MCVPSIRREASSCHTGYNPWITSFPTLQKYIPLNTELKEIVGGDYCLLHDFYNSIHSSLLYVNEMEYQLVQTAREWVMEFVLY
jgi:hypothetical protein